MKKVEKSALIDSRWMLSLAAAGLLSITLTACDSGGDAIEGAAENAGNAVEEAKEAVEGAADQAKEAVEDVKEKVEEKTEG